MIDPHVHLRDWNQADKETLVHGFQVALSVGIHGLFEMPNTDPPLTSKERIVQRLKDGDAALEALGGGLFHGVYGGVTQKREQLEEMVSLWKELFPRVVGLKYFAGHSTGDMGVIGEHVQSKLFKDLVELGFTGVLAIHCEEESLLRSDRWNPTVPESHSQARPEVAELVSVSNQLAMASEVGFQGVIHICHVSTPKVIHLIERWREQNPPFTITTGVTPHHLLLSDTLQRGTTGNELKMNPPLRSEESRAELMELFLAGRIDWIESDHAPHTLEDKRRGASGIPGIPGYRLLVEYLRGLGISPHELTLRTEKRVVEVFQLAKEPIWVERYGDDSIHKVGKDRVVTSYKDVAGEYPFDSFKDMLPRMNR